MPSEQWNKTFDGTGHGWAVLQTIDGGYILSATGAGILKTDQNGIETWRKIAFFTPSDYPDSIQQTSEGGYILAGFTGETARLLKTDSNGDEQWSKNYLESFGYTEANSVQQTSDGGYILAGMRKPNGEDRDFLLLKT